MFKFIGKLIKFSLVFCVLGAAALMLLGSLLPKEDLLAAMTPQELVAYQDAKAADIELAQVERETRLEVLK